MAGGAWHLARRRGVACVSGSRGRARADEFSAGSIVFAFAGAFIGDQAAFIILRWLGSQAFERFPSLATRTSRLRSVLARRAVPAIFLTRFLWGMRMAAYATLANSGIRYPVFFIVNAISCAAWATAVGGLAFVSSQSVAAIIARMADVQKIGLEAAGLLVGGAIVIMLVRWLAGRLRTVQ